MKLFKKLFSRKSQSDSPEGCGKLAGDNIPGERPPLTSHPEGVPENFDSTCSPLLEPGNKRNGKIAKLPRHIRDHINRSFDSGQTAVYITEQLNKLPEVKAVLDNHFGGRPITQNNLSEWKAGGYRDWLARQELLRQKSEFAADANELAETAKGLPDSLFGMALLDYARLLKNADKETPEDFEKKRKALSNMVSDIVRLRRCETQVRGVAVQEERLERDREKTAEEMFQKFMEWASNPEIRRAFILHPMACMALQRRHFGLPPRPEDAAVLKEYDLAKEAENQGNTTDLAPSSTEKTQAPATPSEPQRGSVTQPGVGTPVPSPGSNLNNPPNSERVESNSPPPSPASEDIVSKKEVPIPPSSPAGCGTLAGDNIPGERPPMTPRPEGAPENPASTLSPRRSDAKAGEDELLSAEGADLNPKSKIQNHQSQSSDLDDSLSRIYAALSPAPELLEERNRKHEELRRQAEANRQARLIQSQFGQSSSPLDSFSEPAYPHAPKPSQPGFSPPPAVPFPVHSIFGEIHHPSDNRRCHTS